MSGTVSYRVFGKQPGLLTLDGIFSSRDDNMLAVDGYLSDGKNSQ